MQHSWDPDKERRNVAKHGLDFTFAELVFADPHLAIVFDRVEDGEERWHAVGRVGEHRVLVVVHTYPDPSNDEAVRIIGVREATRGENPLWGRSLTIP
jgi:uncharacterized DUF497 family protein